MHKDEAAQLFGVLSHPVRVKTMKMLYHNGALTKEQLATMNGITTEDIVPHIELLCSVGFVNTDHELCMIDKDRLHDLLTFIPTPCGCVK